jgi:peptidoglycan/LPS O-acetylase OafA/YrhL
MLQRIQTVWLFLSTVCLFGLFLFPYIQVLNAAGAAQVLKVTGVYENVNGQVVQTEPFLLLTIATVIVGFIPFLIIFYYQNRKRQLTISYLAILVVIVYSFWLATNARKVIGEVELELGNYAIGAILPSLAIFFLILAIRGIRRDEKLIKSADRLR